MVNTVRTTRRQRIAAARISLAEFAATHCKPLEANEPREIKVLSVDKETGAIHVMHVIAKRMDITKPICSVMLGENQPSIARFGAGAAVMLAGVCIAKLLGHGHGIVAYAADIVGYGIHGLGATPFIEHLARKVKEAKAK